MDTDFRVVGLLGIGELGRSVMKRFVDTVPAQAIRWLGSGALLIIALNLLSGSFGSIWAASHTKSPDGADRYVAQSDLSLYVGILLAICALAMIYFLRSSEERRKKTEQGDAANP